MVRKLTNLNLDKIDEIHSPYQPEELRDGDPIHGEIVKVTGSIPIRVWRYSPVGVEFFQESGHSLQQGEQVELKIKLGPDVTIFKGIVVDPKYEEGAKFLTGVRIFVSRDSSRPGADRRLKTRWNCADEFLPTGTAPNPLKYNDFILFRVVDISAGGMQIHTSMRNKLLGIGQRLEASISLPLVGSVQATLEIKRMDVMRKESSEVLSLGVTIPGAESILSSSLSEYLLNFAEGTTLRSLNKEGFSIKSAAKWLDFGYVKSEEEYIEVLKLRLKTYQLAGKISGDLDYTAMADEFDSRSRILVVKNNGQIVGSLRAMFHGNSDATDHGRYCAFPSDFPKQIDFVESSRVCTDPEYRGSDILFELLAHLLLLTVKSGRRYIVGGGAGTLIDFYRTCGFSPVGVKYKNASLGGVEHQLLIMDSHNVALARGIGPKSWTRLYGRVVEHMIQKEIIIPTSYDRVRINFLRGLGEVFKW